jgi:alkylhydroperoxidase family enzyme
MLQIVIHFFSQANDSPYALNVHLHGLSTMGISEDLLHSLVEDFDNCPLPQRQKAAIRFGLLAGTQPHDLTEADYAALYQQGLSDTEIFELIATANLFAGVNQYTDAMNLEIDTI